MTEGATLVAIGNFDGVHRGHVAVLKEASVKAQHSGLKPVVLTFDPHPAQVLGRQELPVLTELARKTELIERVDGSLRVHVERFTIELAALSPNEFCSKLLVGGLKAAQVIVGKNFRFGQRRSGDFTQLAALGEELGFTASAHSLFCVGDEVVSSSTIRRAVAAGDLATAEELLGRPHSLSGQVTAGEGRGRALRAPTANLKTVPEVLPAFGVYACLVDEITVVGSVMKPRRLARGVLNVGVRPTFGSNEPSVEVHLLDFEADLYERRLRVHLVERLRGERAFASADDLARQIAVDVEKARARLSDCQPNASSAPAWY